MVGWVEFEWDPEKSITNEQKHGISFQAAQELWNDSGLVVLPSRFSEEPRFLAIGRIGTVCWTAIFTEREGRIRLISVRRSRDNERVIYEQNQP